MIRKKYKVTEIKANACKKLTKLTKVTIGKNVAKIGKNAFKDCKNVKNLTIKTALLTEKTVGAGAFKFGNKKAITVKCPKGKQVPYGKVFKKKGLKKATYK